jgi:diguanylate cyclase (GGDEF)-like protein
MLTVGKPAKSSSPTSAPPIHLFFSSQCYVDAVDHLMTYDDNAVRELSQAWMQRCRASGTSTIHEDSEERHELLVTLERASSAGALARVRGMVAPGPRQPMNRSAGTVGQRRHALDEASEAWGRRVGDPALVVEQMLQLRHLVSGSSEGDRIARLVDRSMLVAARSATDRLQQAAFSDPLTGCANRRGLERDLERELARCARAELDLTVVAIDVDGLKAINDTYGHRAGDETLLRLVETLRRALRGLDGVYRIGGDEFIVVLPDTAREDADLVMNRVERMGAPEFSWGSESVLWSGLLDGRMLLAAADDNLYAQRRHRRGLTGLAANQPATYAHAPLPVLSGTPQEGATG